MDDRRRAKRYRAWFPMRLEATEVGDRLAVSRNVSNAGLLMATALDLALGEPVIIKLRMHPVGPAEHIVAGTIVRFQSNDEDPNGLWPFMVAVEFDEPDVRLEAILMEIGAEVDEPSSGD